MAATPHEICVRRYKINSKQEEPACHRSPCALAASTVNFGGKVHGGTVMKWIDEAGLCLRHALGPNATASQCMGGIRFHRPIMIGDLVEVEARLAYTGTTSMNIAVEVQRRREGTPGENHWCLIVFVSVDSHGRPMPVDAWTPETPGEVALASRVKAQLDASRAAA